MSQSSTKAKVQLLKEWMGSEAHKNMFKIRKRKYIKNELR